jgi:O-antigen ligase
VTARRIRYERMMWALRVTARVTFVAALAGTVLPGAAGRKASAVAVGLVIAAPLVRVSWLAYRWWRWGDRRFASVAASLLLVVGTGTAIAMITR